MLLGNAWELAMLHDVRRVVTAPFFLLGVVLSVILVVLAIASISVSSWFEVVLVRLGLHSKSSSVPGILGVVIYLGFGVVGLALLGMRWLGWTGAFLGPLLGAVAIAILDRW
jgi:hypothetical protein